MVAMETMAAAISADKDAIMDSEVNRYLREPVLVRDSCGDTIPQNLVQAYERAGVHKMSEALCVLLHVLMSESGFIPQVQSLKNV